MSEIEWSPEQEKVINQMIKESEDIGYVQGRDDSTNEFIQELEEFIQKIKLKIIRN